MSVTASPTPAAAPPGRQPFERWWRRAWENPSRAAPGASRVARAGRLALLASASFCVVAGALSLASTSADVLRLPALGALVLSFIPYVATHRASGGGLRRGALALLVLAVAGFVLLGIAPEYAYGYEINGIIHRTVWSSIILLALGLPALSMALYSVMGETPSAWDRSRYPLLLFPIALVAVAYASLVIRLVVDGAPALSVEILTTPYDVRLTGSEFIVQPGMRNHLLGTLLLVAMTSAFALPVGVGAGVCMSEVEGWPSELVRYSTLVLRAISVFILGVTAYTLADWGAQYPPGDLRSDLLRGYYYDDGGFKIAGHGSFLTASIVLSMLVIPVIARATEEGFRSVPREIREGSVALGATEGHGFLHILLPWSMPNVLTGLILGCAEAAGSVAVLLFIAGAGEFGVGPLREATSLSFLIFFVERSNVDKSFSDAMMPYQYSAAFVLLVITLGLTILAVTLKQRFSKRYRGVLY